MTTNSRGTLLIVIAVATQAISSSSLASNRLAMKVSGCDLLLDPSKYNGKLVSVQGLVHSDYEHFDLRFKCKGYIQLETSEGDADLRKFGFQTRQDKNYQALIKSVENQGAIGPNCIQCSSRRSVVHATIEGLFRCHYDFLDCSDVSPMGDSSLVISSVKSIRVESAKPAD